MSKRRVVITGLGIVSPVGIGAKLAWENIVAGQSGISRITHFDPSAFACQVAGEIKGAATVVFFLGRKLPLPKNFFLIPDAIGLALFTVIGTSIAIKFGTPWLIAALMGVITGVFGGVIRDILCNEIPLIFRTDIYATASLVGALLWLF